jgi:NADH-quinone oxidoreductase subunit C
LGRPGATDMASAFERIVERLGGHAPGAAVSHGILVLPVDASVAGEVARALKSEFGFDIFLDVTAVDWIGQSPRFEVVWHFYSTTDKMRVRVKARVPEDNPEVESLKPLYGSAGFMERECHEMYGIRFRGNADLRPALLYEGFVGHPLRKDYPKRKEQPLIPYRDELEGKIT